MVDSDKYEFVEQDINTNKSQRFLEEDEKGASYAIALSLQEKEYINTNNKRLQEDEQSTISLLALHFREGKKKKKKMTIFL